MFKKLQSSIGTGWCTLIHKSIMWPAHGHYQCRTCGRRYPAFANVATASLKEGACAMRVEVTGEPVLRGSIGESHLRAA